MIPFRSLLVAILLFAAAASAATFTVADAGPMHAARRLHTATLLPDGTVLIAGGFASGAPLASAEIFDPVSRTFRVTGSMRYPRHSHTATALADGRVLIAGGVGVANVCLSAAEIYDPANGTFTRVSSTGPARCEHVAALLDDGRVLVAGGRNESTSAIDATELFDPALKAFVSGPKLPRPRDGVAVTKLRDGRVFIGGGAEVDPKFTGSGNGTSTSMLIYDPKSNALETVTPDVPPRPNLLAQAGRNAMTLPTGEVVLFQPGAWLLLQLNGTTYTVRNQFHTGGVSADEVSTLLPDGRLLLVSGRDYGLLSKICMVVEPRQKQWSEVGSIKTARSHHTVTLLRDGSVLVTGGLTQLGPTATAEVVAYR